MKSQTNDKHSELLQRLNEQVEALRGSEGWQSWLRTAARFRTYSVFNQLLILSQRPEATQVAGFGTWKSLGRHVKKGEKGIGILAPIVRTVLDDDEQKQVVSGFRTAYVWDISQTDGEDLPSLAMPDVVVPDDTLHQRLLDVAETEGFRVVMAPTTGKDIRGWWDPSAKTITVIDSYTKASQARTLLHELAHAFDPEAVPGFRDRPEREQVAESAAYLVGVMLGIDMEEASTYYVTAWRREADDLGRIAAKVLRVAERLEQAIVAVPAELTAS
jgi:hypothetical protein